MTLQDIYPDPKLLKKYLLKATCDMVESGALTQDIVVALEAERAMFLAYSSSCETFFNSVIKQMQGRR